MELVLSAYIKVQEHSKRTKLQITAIILFAISIVIEMIYSKYYMLVLLAPMFFLGINYIKLKKSLNHYQKCTAIFSFNKNFLYLEFRDLPVEWSDGYIISYNSIEHIDCFDNGSAVIQTCNITNRQPKKIRKKTFDFIFNCDDLNKLQESLSCFLPNTD